MLLILMSAASMLVGSNRIPAAEVFAALFGGSKSPESTVILTQRLPRTILGFAAGMALGVAGALMQGHTRNPLAEPGLFGVNAGAAFGVVILSFALHIHDPFSIVSAALIGSLAATVLVIAISWSGRGRGTPVTMALTGTALGAILAAATTALVLSDRQTLDVMRYWQVGSLSGRDSSTLPLLLSLIGIGLALALMNGPSVTALGLGDDVARGLGNHVALSRVVGITSITLLTAAATAACGPIAFIGLVAPWAVRAITGPRYTRLIPLSALAGAIILLSSDVAGRVVLESGELPVGLISAVIGAPVLVAVVARKRVTQL